MHDADTQRNIDRHVAFHQERADRNTWLRRWSELSLMGSIGWTEFMAMDEQTREAVYQTVVNAAKRAG